MQASALSIHKSMGTLDAKSFIVESVPGNANRSDPFSLCTPAAGLSCERFSHRCEKLRHRAAYKHLDLDLFFVRSRSFPRHS